MYVKILYICFIQAELRPCTKFYLSLPKVKGPLFIFPILTLQILQWFCQALWYRQWPWGELQHCRFRWWDDSSDVPAVGKRMESRGPTVSPFFVLNQTVMVRWSFDISNQKGYFWAKHWNEKAPILLYFIGCYQLCSRSVLGSKYGLQSIIDG